ncbi:hypothetical protein [Botrimarina sp.]|uniref:hypothetical protein n=1 Tax=Botrimarina sp. TaxID=2795802 RepID=UPI0032EB1CB2
MAEELGLTAALDSALTRLRRSPIGGYHADGPAASEPIAWAAIALAHAGEPAAAQAGARWLAERQAGDGSVGVTAEQAEPAWTTALAILAWRAVDPVGYAQPIASASDWALDQEPWTQPPNPVLGHDLSLAGWSWAPDTHSWLEPTAFFAVALRDGTLATHPRRVEAVRLLQDRLLPSGGANYGNTVVFGQELLQHAQASGVAAWALAGERVDDPRLRLTLDYLADTIRQPLGAASVAWAVRGLAAHGLAGEDAAARLSAAWSRVGRDNGLYKPALFALAAQATLTHNRLPIRPVAAR